MKVLRDLGIGLLVVIVGWVLWTWAEPRLSRRFSTGEGITNEAAASIQEGMTRWEVERIFGCPSGDYSSEGGRAGVEGFAQAGHEIVARGVNWRSDQVEVMVWFSVRTGTVTRVEVRP